MVATVTALGHAITLTLKGGKRRTSPRLYAAEQPGAEARIKRSFRALSAALAAEAPEETGRSKTQTLERRRTRSRGLSM